MTDMTDMTHKGELADPTGAPAPTVGLTAPAAPTARSDIVPAEVIQTFVGKVEPGDHVSLSVVLGSVAFSLLVIFATTAWWMLK